MQDVEWAVERIDDAHRAEIHPRRPLIDAVRISVSIHRVKMKARNVPWLEDVTDFVQAPTIRAMNFTVAVLVLTDGMNRTAAHEIRIACVAGP